MDAWSRFMTSLVMVPVRNTDGGRRTGVPVTEDAGAGAVRKREDATILRISDVAGGTILRIWEDGLFVELLDGLLGGVGAAPGGRRLDPVDVPRAQGQVVLL